MSGVYGVQRPIIKYGTSYGTTWNTQTDLATGEAVSYELDDSGITEFFESELDGKITPIDLVSGKRRLKIKMLFSNLEINNANRLRSIINGTTAQITIHADNSLTEFIFYIKKARWFGTTLPYPLYQSAVVWFETVDVETLPVVPL